MPDHRLINSIFPQEASAIEHLRKTDAGFGELCDHLELLLTEMSQKFGSIDQATTDLISSFDDVRREIERHLKRHASQPPEEAGL